RKGTWTNFVSAITQTPASGPPALLITVPPMLFAFCCPAACHRNKQTTQRNASKAPCLKLRMLTAPLFLCVSGWNITLHPAKCGENKFRVVGLLDGIE